MDANIQQGLAWNITGLHPPGPGSRTLLQAQNGDAVYFVDYKPPARDTIMLPRNLLYVLAGVALVVVATYAIVGHLINDLIHDLADWVLGPKGDLEDAERGSGGGGGGGEDDDDDEESVDNDGHDEGRRMSEVLQAPGFPRAGARFLPGLQRCASVSYPCTNHGGRPGVSKQQRGSCPSEIPISIPIPIPHVTSI
ncbi:hypothetical protein AMEX_G6068 [Astyanax mexicanus]|uniref:Uncharacterized protein n=1 Tax=Astyanax mexicanus TaxID=7994 RepID=A0A8T2M902_ASTMX|nr:hypothetical protein AMEX_G6068 [Astyanax mexicanus]